MVTTLLFSGNLAPVFASALVKIEADGSVDFDNNNNITYAIKNARLMGEDFLLTAAKLTYNATSSNVDASGGVTLFFQKDQVNIVAESIIYDLNTKIAQAIGGVKLHYKDAVLIEAEQLSYNGNIEQVVADGGSEAKITFPQGVYFADRIDYLLKEKKGDFSSLRSIIEINGHDYSLRGENAEHESGLSKIKGVQITKCPKPKPDYILFAKKAKFDGSRLVLSQIVLYIKEIPIFYFPIISFEVGQAEIAPTYSDDGLNIEYATPVRKNMGWAYQAELKTKGIYYIGAGLSAYQNDFKNYMGVFYNFKGTWGIEDKVTLERSLFRITIEGSREFSKSLPTQCGIGITRKYWDGIAGKWQFGILGSKASAFDTSNSEYGGIYWGTRLDYNPHPYVVLSLLEVESLIGGDYRDLMKDFKPGSNWLYSVRVPISKLYTFGLDGTYNTDQSLWTHRIFRLTRETCCFRVSLGWDDAISEMVFGAALKL